MSKRLSEKEKLIIFISSCAVFVILNIFFLFRDNYLFAVFPIGLIFIIWAFLAMDKLLLAIVFMAPLSVTLSDLGIESKYDLFLPTEPLLFGVALLFLMKMFYEKKYDYRVTKHPISLAIYAYLTWLFITSITSTMPLISFKFFIAKIWFIVPFYFFGIYLFKEKKNIKQYAWVYIFGLLAVIIYTLFRQFQLGFLSQKVAHFAVTPFFRDHTAYGAALTFVLPVLIAFLTIYKTRISKVLITFLIIIYLFALVLSYTRAAWVSIIISVFVWGCIRLRINAAYIFSGILIVLLVTLFNNHRIMMYLEKNKQESTGDLAKHAQSIANITTDASNLERINRWKSAWRMFKEKPYLGFGPNTYMFQYAPYQMSYEKTIISTNFGDRGNAHSEYLGPLAESGILGMLTFLLIVILSAYYGIKVYYRCQTKEMKNITMGVLIGLFTYFIHGILNNFLTTDKTSALFWGFIGIIVAIDLYHKDQDSLASQDAKKIPHQE